MYLIEQGHITIYARDHSGQEKLLRTFDAGDVVGEFALLDGQPRSARAQASGGPLHVLTLQRAVFMRFIQSRPGVILAMLQYLADKARFTTQAVETSITWMTQIAEGRYQTSLDQLPAFDTAPTAPADDEVPVVELGPSELSEETPALISRVFSKAAALLQEREHTLRGKAQPKSP
jgi:CRP-like cAMP-binding protein